MSEAARVDRFSRHAEVRCRQRSIPEQVVEWLLDFGSPRRRGRCDVYTFDKRARRALHKHLGDSFYRRITALLDCDAVVADDGSIVTVAKRIGRLRID